MRTFPGCVLLLAAGLLGVAALTLTACEPEITAVIDGTCDPSRMAEVTSQEYFDTVMVPTIFAPHCSYCHWSDRTGDARHGAPSGVDYDTADEAKARISTTWFRVKTYDMPPMGKVPSPAQMDTLNEWLNCARAESTSGDDDDSAR